MTVGDRGEGKEAKFWMGTNFTSSDAIPGIRASIKPRVQTLMRCESWHFPSDGRSGPDLDRQGRRGGQAKLSVEDHLLVALAYWREYRSQFHIGVNWGLHETTVGRIVKKVEDRLIKSGKFRLPSQRQLYEPGWEWKVMVVDVGEIEIERPQKNRNATTAASSAARR